VHVSGVPFADGRTGTEDRRLRMRMFRTLGPLLVALFAATDARAEPYTILPGGDLIFNTSLTTRGTFFCGSVVTCTDSGTNAITLHSSAGTVTLSFSGVSTTIGVGNRTIPVTLGTFEGEYSGFEPPASANRYVPLVLFDLSLSHSSPTDDTTNMRWRFGPGLARSAGGTFLALPSGPNPPGYNYGSIIYSLRVFPLILPTSGSRDLVADVGVVPEPASMVLLGTGIAGLYMRRRKQKRVL
jgi:hypothetical protein